MAITIQKPISRDLLKEVIHDFDEYALYEILKNQKIIDTPENYIRDDGSSPDALLVIDDTTTTPSTGEVGYSKVLFFIDDITIGEYVVHIEEVSHTGNLRYEKYARRVGQDMSDDEISDLWDASAETVKALKNLIQDEIISTEALWSSYKIDSVVQDTKTLAKEYVDNLIGSHSTLKLEVVSELPDTSSADTGTLYILHNETETGYPIYIYSTTLGWVKTGADLGSIDLSNYYTKVETNGLLENYPKKTETVMIENLLKDITVTNDVTVLSSKAVKTEIDKKLDKAQDISDAGKALIIGDDGNVTTKDITTKISSKSDNAISNITTTGEEGIYVDDTAYVKVNQGTTVAGKALVINDEGKVTTGDAGVKVSSKSGNAISSITDEGKEGIYVDESAFVSSSQDAANAGKSLVVGTDGKVTTSLIEAKISTKGNNVLEKVTETGKEGLYVDGSKFQAANVISSEEPTDQAEGSFWIKEY